MLISNWKWLVGPIKASQILADLLSDYGITCELRCAVYDLNGNGFYMSDFLLRLPDWPAIHPVPDLTPIVDCLDAR